MAEIAHGNRGIFWLHMTLRSWQSQGVVCNQQWLHSSILKGSPIVHRELNAWVLHALCRGGCAAQDQEFAQIPVQTAMFERELAAVDARLAALKQLQPASVRCQALAQTDIPALRQRVQELEAAAEQGADALEAVSTDSIEAQHALQVSLSSASPLKQMQAALLGMFVVQRSGTIDNTRTFGSSSQQAAVFATSEPTAAVFM